jgi:two-component sensor histidine kinase
MEIVHFDPLHAATDSVQESWHRIGNNLSLISSFVRMKAKDSDVVAARGVLLDVAARIDTVSRLHRLLAHATSDAAPIAQLLRDVCDAMQSIAENRRLRISIDCPDTISLRSNAAVHLGLLVSELLSNSAKYAHPAGLPTDITISCVEDGGHALTFTYEDDGVGFPEHFDPARTDSLGMRVIESASRRLNGTCEWQDLGIGLRFVCRFRI